MKCARHDLDAIGICAYCGRALCRQCVPNPTPTRLACDESCAAALKNNERFAEHLLEKSLQSARANSVYYYICGLLSAGATVAAWFWLPIPLLMWFTGGSAAALIFSGFWFGRLARRTKQ
ncbi:MAG TPA: hypothetical protein VGN61_11940 [Verrucomicrobiae bacterium]